MFRRNYLQTLVGNPFIVESDRDMDGPQRAGAVVGHTIDLSALVDDERRFRSDDRLDVACATAFDCAMIDVASARNLQRAR
jgi:hypothetical protein